MKESIFLFLCCMSMFFSLQNMALATQDEVSITIVEYTGLEEKGSSVPTDSSIIELNALANSEVDSMKVNHHERGHVIDPQIYHELKQRAENPDIPETSSNSHIPNLPDAASDNSQGIGRPHTVVSTMTPNYLDTMGLYPIRP